MELNKLKVRLNELNEQIDDIDININELEDIVYQLEEDVNHAMRCCNQNEIDSYNKLLKEIKKIKNENDFYDADAELDRMFPNRHDDDFDEDAISYDSVFGDD